MRHQIFNFDDFTLDLKRGSLFRGGEEIRLRPKSFKTLEYLVENTGRLISKDELVEAVWAETAVTDNSLVQCLKEVRVALGDRTQRFIRTVPKRGYIFEKRVITDQDRETAYVKEAKSRANKDLGIANLTSIAILPFKPLNGNDGDEYLGLGIADTLITRLGSDSKVVVRPTSSIQKYTSNCQDTLAAGREQKVDAVLEGSIQTYGERIRVTARLINVSDGSTLWVYIGDETFADIFALQDAISEKVAYALALQVSGEGQASHPKRYTDNVEAYRLYVKGVFLRNQMTEDSLRKSVECFRKAIDLDPNYALAYCGEASSNSPLVYLGYLSLKEAEVRNRALVAKALRLDDSLAEAHAAYGEFKLFIEWDWNGAERAFKRALQLNPTEQLTRLLYPDLLLIKGRCEDAIAMTKAALELDPLSPRVGKALAWLYYLTGQYDNAIEQGKATRELFPQYHLISFGPAYEQKGMYDEAVDRYLETEMFSGLSSDKVAVLQKAYTTSGWNGFWQKRLELMKETEMQAPRFAVRSAEIYAKLGNKKAAIEWLEKAYNDREMSLIFLGVDPAWKVLQSDPGFQDLLGRLGLAI